MNVFQQSSNDPALPPAGVLWWQHSIRSACRGKKNSRLGSHEIAVCFYTVQQIWGISGVLHTYNMYIDIYIYIYLFILHMQSVYMLISDLHYRGHSSSSSSSSRSSSSFLNHPILKFSSCRLSTWQLDHFLAVKNSPKLRSKFGRFISLLSFQVFDTFHTYQEKFSRSSTHLQWLIQHFDPRLRHASPLQMLTLNTITLYTEPHGQYFLAYLGIT